MYIPNDFARTIGELYDQDGRAWLQQLPARLAECERRWALTLAPPFNLSYNYVAPATRADGTPVVVKVGFPSPELLTEIAALRHYDGHGSAWLIDADADQGSMLLERLQPGAMLAAIDDDDQATMIAAEVMRQLWRPAPKQHSFPTTAKWAAGLGRLRVRFGGGTGPLPAALVARAEVTFAELLASAGAPVLLHGDLHHENILAAQRRPWLAIDPKGVVGEPAYEAGALLRNPGARVLGAASPARMLARRVDILAEQLGIERERLIGWGFAQAVLSAWWVIENHGHGWEKALALAEHLAALMS